MAEQQNNHTNNSHVAIDITQANDSVRMSRLENRNRQNNDEDDNHLSARRPRSRSNSGNSPTRPRSNSNQGNRRQRRDVESAINDAVPLLETNTPLPRQQPPTAGPEIDEDDDIDNNNDVPYTPEARPGVDDGFFPQNGNGNGRPNGRRDREDEDDDNISRRNNKPVNGNGPRRESLPRNFPYAPEFPNAISGNDLPTRIIPDVNVYQQKKNLAQGMMDLALLSANANQLRYVVETFERHPYFYFSVVFISFSLILQVAVGIGLILNSRYNVKNQDDICKADKINNYTIIGIFLITVVNVFIASFGVAEAPRSNI